MVIMSKAISCSLPLFTLLFIFVSGCSYKEQVQPVLVKRDVVAKASPKKKICKPPAWYNYPRKHDNIIVGLGESPNSMREAIQFAQANVAEQIENILISKSHLKERLINDEHDQAYVNEIKSYSKGELRGVRPVKSHAVSSCYFVKVEYDDTPLPTKVAKLLTRNSGCLEDPVKKQTFFHDSIVEAMNDKSKSCAPKWQLLRQAEYWAVTASGKTLTVPPYKFSEFFFINSPSSEGDGLELELNQLEVEEEEDIRLTIRKKGEESEGYLSMFAASDLGIVVSLLKNQLEPFNIGSNDMLFPQEQSLQIVCEGNGVSCSELFIVTYCQQKIDFVDLFPSLSEEYRDSEDQNNYNYHRFLSELSSLLDGSNENQCKVATASVRVNKK